MTERQRNDSARSARSNTVRPVEEIREALRERERNRPKITGRPGRARAGRPHTARTRERLAELQRRRRRAEALADPDCHPLRRARVTFKGDGISQRELAELALVSEDHIHAIETGAVKAGPMTAQRLARALRCRPATLGLE